MEKRCNRNTEMNKYFRYDVDVARIGKVFVCISFVLFFCFIGFTSKLNGNTPQAATHSTSVSDVLPGNHPATIESVSADSSGKGLIPQVSEEMMEHQLAGSQLYGVSSQYVAWSVDGGGLVSTKVYFPTGVQKPCPVVIFSHGLGGSIETGAYLGKMWASRGIVSFHLDHPGSNEQIWRGKVRAKDVLRSAYQTYWHGRDRALTIRFVLDKLADIVTGKAADQAHLAPMLDMKRIGVTGNDLGALAALLVAGQLPPDNGESLKDDRVAAVVALSPPVFCNEANAPLVYAGVQVPFMSFGGTLDDGLVGSTKAWQRRIPFDSLANVDRYHVTLQGADHLVYSGVRPRSRQSQGYNDTMFQKTIMEVSTAFWALYLKDDSLAARLLKDSPERTALQAGVLEKHLL